MHPFVIGELAYGNLGDRHQTLALLEALPEASVATHREALVSVERHAFMGRELGYVDVHLLASAALGDDRLLTRDRTLARVATELGL